MLRERERERELFLEGFYLAVHLATPTQVPFRETAQLTSPRKQFSNQYQHYPESPRVKGSGGVLCRKSETLSNLMDPLWRMIRSKG